MSDLVALAIEYHKTVEGEYGCPGESCPGVQRLVVLLKTSAPGSVRIDVPQKMWDRLRESADGNGYCPLCDRHPHGGGKGHDNACPLSIGA